MIDYLETRADVNPRRIGLWGISLGGYFCPRAVAVEPRFSLGVKYTGCVQHAGADTQAYGTDYINDWVAETFAELMSKCAECAA